MNKIKTSLRNINLKQFLALVVLGLCPAVACIYCGVYLLVEKAKDKHIKTVKKAEGQILRLLILHHS